MWYLSERLLWLGEDGDLVVSDTSLNNSAALNTSSLGVLHFTVMLPDLQPMPGRLPGLRLSGFGFVIFDDFLFPSGGDDIVYDYCSYQYCYYEHHLYYCCLKEVFISHV